MTMPSNRIRELRTVRAGDLKAGTTIIAAERQHRTCYAMEIDPSYVDAALVEAAEMPVHEAVESALQKSAMSGNVTAQIFYLCNRAKERWTHVNQVKVDTKIDVHVGTEQALQAKIMGMAQLSAPEEKHDGP